MMLQLERRTRQTSDNKTKNFLALNKSLVKAKSKQEAAKRQEKERDRKEQPRRKPRPDSQSPTHHKQSHPHQQERKSANNKETVTISKDYLEQLLRQSFMKDNAHNYNSLPLDVTSPPSFRPKDNSSAPVSNDSHVVLDHTLIPGLERHRNDTKPHPNSVTSPQLKQSLTNPKDGTNLRKEILPSLSQTSPRMAESYHRGTVNRPVHPAMRSNIVFGGGQPEIKRWQTEPSYPSNQSHLITPRVVNEDRGAIDGDRRRDGDGVNDNTHWSPRDIGVNRSIDLFMKEKEDEKRLKELAYREELRLQIEEKKRKAEEERLLKERDDRLEEERLAKERERLTREFEQEKEKQRMKEIEASRKVALMQQRIKMAEQSALAAKEKEKKAKFHRTSQNDQNDQSHRLALQTSADQYITEDSLTNQQEQYIHEESHISVPVIQFDLNFRSPSMLQVLEPPPSNKSLLKSPRHIKPSQVEHKNSRSHLKNSFLASGSQVSLYSTSSEEPNHMTHKTRPKPSSGKTASSSGLVKETRTQRRNVMRKQIEKTTQNKSDSESECHDKSSGRPRIKPSSGNNNKTLLPNSVARSKVNPKQAAARTLKNQSLNRSVRMRIPNPPSSPDCHITHDTAPAKQVKPVLKDNPPPPPPSSPPVPAVARRLAQGQQTNINDIHSSGMTGGYFPNDQHETESSDHLPSLSILPVHHNSIVQSSPPKTTVPKLPQIMDNNTVTITKPATQIVSQIERAPSCSPDNQPLNEQEMSSFRAQNVCHLPPIHEIRSREEKRISEREHDSISNDQQQLLNSLLKLKQSIATHTHDVDCKIKNILWRRAT